MGGRWAAAAVVVLGIISSLNLQVEGDALTHAKAIMESYLVIAFQGKEKADEPCESPDQQSHILENMKEHAGKTAEQLVAEFTGPPGNAEQKFQVDKGEFKRWEKQTKEWCSPKKKLMCEESKCLDCGANPTVTYCDSVNHIAKQNDTEPKKDGGGGGSGGSGGWMVSPVDGALVAALLALLALST